LFGPSERATYSSPRNDRAQDASDDESHPEKRDETRGAHIPIVISGRHGRVLLELACRSHGIQNPSRPELAYERIPLIAKFAEFVLECCDAITEDCDIRAERR
jgi:hypothetical protein